PFQAHAERRSPETSSSAPSSASRAGRYPREYFHRANPWVSTSGRRPQKSSSINSDLGICKASGKLVDTDQKVPWSTTRIAPAETRATGSCCVEQQPSRSSTSLRTVSEETQDGGGHPW